MSSLYEFPEETTKRIRKFRLSGSRARTVSAEIYKIDTTKYTVEYDEPDDPIDSLAALQEELPDNTPRFVIMNYPYKSKDGRLLSPLVLIFYRPLTARQQAKMLYAGCLERFKSEVSPNEFLEVEDGDEFDDLDGKLRVK